MSITAMKQALEALESAIDQLAKPYSTQAQYAITYLRQAIARAEGTLEAEMPSRHELQAKGEHPAPCARFCEANAFNIEVRALKSKLETMKVAEWSQHPHTKALQQALADTSQKLAGHTQNGGVNRLLHLIVDAAKNDDMSRVIELAETFQDKFCDSNCVWSDHHPDCVRAENKEAAPVAKNEGGRITWLVDDWPANCLLYAEPPKWTPVEIGVDVTSEGAHVVGMYVLMPEAVRHVFYSQFHPTPEAEKQEPVAWQQVMERAFWRMYDHGKDNNPVSAQCEIQALRLLCDGTFDDVTAWHPSQWKLPQRQPLTDEQKDAERYRWLRNKAMGYEGVPFICILNNGYTGQLDGEAADKEIDDAIEAANGIGEKK